MHDERLAITEKAALVAVELMRGRAYTSAEVARRFDFSQEAARRMLNRISNVLPIERDELGRWRRAEQPSKTQ